MLEQGKRVSWDNKPKVAVSVISLFSIKYILKSYKKFKQYKSKFYNKINNF
jgi:hypothetical protein